MEKSRIIAKIKEKAAKYDLPPEVVYGICMAESNLNPYAIRYEPKYRWLEDPKSHRPKGCSLDTETSLQKHSLGIMQVMGGVFREHGFTGWLTEVFADIDLQIEYGCKHLRKRIDKWGSLEKGVSSYNCGDPDRNHDGAIDNPEYVENVKSHFKEWMTLEVEKEEVKDAVLGQQEEKEKGEEKISRSTMDKILYIFNEIVSEMNKNGQQDQQQDQGRDGVDHEGGSA